MSIGPPGEGVFDVSIQEGSAKAIKLNDRTKFTFQIIKRNIFFIVIFLRLREMVNQ